MQQDVERDWAEYASRAVALSWSPVGDGQTAAAGKEQDEQDDDVRQEQTVEQEVQKQDEEQEISYFLVFKESLRA